MSLDLGALVGEVRLDATLFETTYVRVVRQMADLGAKAGAAAAGTSTLDRSLAEAGASANAAAAGLGRADRALAGAGVSASDAAAATTAMHASTSQAALASSRLTQALLRQSAAQARLTELEASGTATGRQLAGARASLLAANDRVALSTERLGKASGVTSNAWQGAGRGMVVAGGLIAAGFVIAGKAAADFDAKMTLVRTLAKASPADMAQLRSAALSVGQAYGYTAGEVADAEAELVKAGISVKDIMGGALAGALTLAAAGQEDVANATNTAAVAMTQFGLSGKDVPHIADLLAAGADKALGSVADLSEALTYGGLASHLAGMSIEETIGVLAELAQSGQLGSIAGTQLAQMLRNLEAPTKNARAEMKALGINVYGSNGQMLSMADIADELHDKIGKLPPAQRDAALAALFTARSVRAASILMRDGGDAVRDWTRKVDDSGFAALQASGKLNSLSGDLTKLKSAFNAALIGTGENAQGPLRSVVHDVTAVIEAWDNLPGPVKTGVEALTGVAGAALLVGGGMLLLLPRIVKTREAMQELGITGSRVGGILGKGGLLVGSIAAATMAVSAIDDAMHHTSLNADAMSASLEHLARTGQVTGEITRAFGSDLSGLKSTISLSGDGVSVFGLKFHSLSQTFSHSGGDFADARNKISSVDQALADMVTSGHADEARVAYDQLADAAKRQGVSVETLAARFPEYSGAVRASGESAANAANGVDKYGNAVGAAAEKTESATAAAKKYADTLHAQADPLFAMNQALQDLHDKQAALTKAQTGGGGSQIEQARLRQAAAQSRLNTLEAKGVTGGAQLAAAKASLLAANDRLTAATAKYGASAADVKQAQLGVASSALDVAAASKALAGSVKDGTTSLAGAKSMLHQWVAAGLITKAEAAAVTAAFGGIITKAGKISGALDSAAAGARNAAPKFGAAGHEAVTSYADGLTTGQVKAIAAAERAGRLSAQAAKNAEAGFTVAGESAADGYADGITAHEVKAIRAAQQMGLLSAQAAKNAIQSSSPSKLFKSIGSTVPEGYALGVKGGLPAVEAVGRDLAAALGSGFSGYSGQIAKLFTGSSLAALNATGRQLNKAVSQYQTDVASRTQMKTSISQGLLGAADISNLALSNTGGGAIRSNNATLIAQLGRENKDVARLRKLHLDPTYLQQIAAASPQQGVALAEDILSGREGSISGLNRQQRQLQSLAGGIGGTVATATFATAIRQDERALDKVAHALVTFVNKKLDLSSSAERAMERAFAAALRKNLPSISLTELDHALGLGVHHAS